MYRPCAERRVGTPRGAPTFPLRPRGRGSNQPSAKKNNLHLRCPSNLRHSRQNGARMQNSKVKKFHVSVPVCNWVTQRPHLGPYQRVHRYTRIVTQWHASRSRHLVPLVKLRAQSLNSVHNPTSHNNCPKPSRNALFKFAPTSLPIPLLL